MAPYLSFCPFDKTACVQHIVRICVGACRSASRSATLYRSNIWRCDHGPSRSHLSSSQPQVTQDRERIEIRLTRPSPLVDIDSREDRKRESPNQNNQRMSSSTRGNSGLPVRSCGRVLGNSWTWELVGIFVCISALVSIFGILLAYDQKPLPHSVAGVSLNTAISILATVSRATTISVAAQIIAQQKWVRFVGAIRPLSIIELYDDATRGPLGSLFLLLSGPRSMLAIAVASVTVLALGFEPFAQQSLSFPSKEALIPHTAPVIRTTTNISYSASDITTNKTVALNALLLEGLYAESVAPLQPICAANTCKWPSYTSAAMCSSCVDALNQTIISSNDSDALTAYTTGNFLDNFDAMVDLSPEMYAYNYSTQTNYSVSMGSGLSFLFSVNFTGYADASEVSGDLVYTQDIVWNLVDRSTPFLGFDKPFWWEGTGPFTSLAYVHLDLSPDGLSLQPSSASICSISLCAQEQTSSSINGTFSRDITHQEWGNYMTYSYNGGVQNKYTWSAQYASQNFTAIDGEMLDTLDGLIDSLEDISTLGLLAKFAGESIYTLKPTTINPASNTLKFIGDTANSSAKIAQVFSNYFDQRGAEFVTGEAYEIVPFVSVRWAWLCFPVFLVLMCSVTLFVTMYQSYRLGLPTWTTSPFPLLSNYHYREKELDLASGPTPHTGHEDSGDERGVTEDPLQSDIKAMPIGAPPKGELSHHYAEWASETRVRLVRHDRHWVFESAT